MKLLALFGDKDYDSVKIYTVLHTDMVNVQAISCP